MKKLCIDFDGNDEDLSKYDEIDNIEQAKEFEITVNEKDEVFEDANKNINEKKDKWLQKLEMGKDVGDETSLEENGLKATVTFKDVKKEFIDSDKEVKKCKQGESEFKTISR